MNVNPGALKRDGSWPPPWGCPLGDGGGVKVEEEGDGGARSEPGQGY